MERPREAGRDGAHTEEALEAEKQRRGSGWRKKTADSRLQPGSPTAAGAALEPGGLAEAAGPAIWLSLQTQASVLP